MDPRPDTLDLSALHFDADQLIPAVAQEATTGDVLLLAYMNAETLRLTWQTSEAHFWSRSRQRIWRKGEASGRRLLVERVALNCEGNSLLLTVRLDGDAACHDGYHSCFYRAFNADGALETHAPRLFAPDTVYGVEVYGAPTAGDVAEDLDDKRANKRADGSADNVAAATNAAGAPGATDASEATANDTVADDLRALYARYLRLRDEDYTAVSSTSRLLRDDATSATWLLGRAHEELAELRGVVAGVHRHTGGQADIILEASQALYWLLLAAGRSGLAYDDWRPHEALLTGWLSARSPVPSAAPGPPIAPLHRALWELGATLRAAGTPPAMPISADLASVRRRLAAATPPDGAAHDAR